MTEETMIEAAGAAAKKARHLFSNPLGYFVLSMLAGIYVGFGIVLIFAIGAPLTAANSPAVKLAMGASFGIALSLVIIAGSELFTGNNMVMAIGMLRRTVSPWAVGAVWLVSFAGNLAGSLALAWLVVRSGVLGAQPHLGVIEKTVTAKMTLSFGTLFYRGLLCNWLVCLAVWSALRTKSEAGKLIMIFWCLFAFIAAGFEHSVANMTLLAIGLLQPHGAAVSISGFVHNLVPVTLGNIAGGALFVGGAYWLANTPLRLPGRTAAAVRQPLAAEGAAGD